MNKDDIIRKLTSRKFWAAVCALITNLVIAFGAAQETAVKITGIIMASAAVVAYIVGEGLIDAASAGAEMYVLPEEKPPENGEEKAV